MNGYLVSSVSKKLEAGMAVCKAYSIIVLFKLSSESIQERNHNEFRKISESMQNHFSIRNASIYHHSPNHK